ncbi:MAG: glycine/D-amino acid oxidase-like deaminating enzyme [Paracoccaceae bacterium]|jgi:glycine/D-amino acid oxidase-like deaminating enzyme
MKRIYSDFAYGPGPRDGCWWDETIVAPDWPDLRGDLRADVVIVGAGFTGLSAALHLAEAGVSVVVLEGQTPGWGASGRNGGFCCIGGSMLDETAMTRRHGAADTARYRQAERDAVALVARLLDRLDIDADTHSKGETQLAHNARAMTSLHRQAESIVKGGGPDPILTEAGDLAAQGLNGPFHGALTTPVGFGLNPRKYLFGLAGAATRAGARLFQRSAVTGITTAKTGYLVATGQGRVSCDTVLIATNGYSSEDLPKWLAGRYLPAQSSVLVTRPLTEAELAAQGWTSDQMAYDTRNLLHYFRLMPDGRFLFGMRGGMGASPGSERKARADTRRDFEAMFPAWRDVPSAHSWSGMVCLAAGRVPYVGPVPGKPGMFVGLAYHGNGVAMGSYAGRLLADLALGQEPPCIYPEMMHKPMAQFPLGRARRLLMPPAYAAMMLADL